MAEAAATASTKAAAVVVAVAVVAAAAALLGLHGGFSVEKKTAGSCTVFRIRYSSF